MDIEKIKSDLDKIISTALEISQRRQADHQKRADQIAVRASALSYLKNLLGEDHEYYKQFEEHTVSGKYIHLNSGISILKILSKDISNEWLFNMKGILAAEVFTDFLEMAEHLLEEGYKDPAAVMIGSTLENHLKQMCTEAIIPTTYTNPKGEERPKKADVLNADLRKAGIYNTLQQKQVTAWLDLRNKAAHGEYDEYDASQVRTMYSEVLNFISKTTNWKP